MRSSWATIAPDMRPDRPRTPTDCPTVWVEACQRLRRCFLVPRYVFSPLSVTWASEPVAVGS